ncbi:hypothetical protein JCM24511_07697 [Saitozyma sp. JCM 24511]|nr:hypothetical protein JCM24511_07697 [Saitozyma sp. JCM 24511]
MPSPGLTLCETLLLLLAKPLLLSALPVRLSPCDDTGPELGLLLLDLPLRSFPRLLELNLTLTLNLLARLEVVWQHPGQPLLELLGRLVLSDGDLTGNLVGLLVRNLVGLLLPLVVIGEKRSLLLTHGTLEVVDALADDAEPVVELAFLFVELLHLERKNLVRVEVLDLGHVDLEGTSGRETLGELASLLASGCLHLLLEPVDLALPGQLLLPSRVLLGNLLLALGLGGGLLPLTARVGLLEKLASLGDDLSPLRNCFALLLGLSNSLGKRLGTSSRWRRVEVLDGVVQADGEVGQPVDVGRLGDEGDALSDVIDRGIDVPAASGRHEELFQRGHVGSPSGAVKGLDQVEHVRESDSVVHLGELLQEAREDDVAESREVRLVLGGEGRDDGSKEFGRLERLEVDLEDVVQLADLLRDAAKVLGGGVLDECITGGHLGQVEKSDEALLALNVPEWDREGGEKDAARRLFRDRTGALGVLEVAGPCSRVEYGGLLATLSLEDLGELLVVVGHHGGLCRLLAGDETVHILNGSEGFLPEFELDSGLELEEASVEVTREGLGVGEVDGMLLVRVLGGVGEVLAETLLAQAAEVGLALVDLAEVERAMGDRLIHDLEAVVTLGDVETDVVGVPAELLCRGDESALDALPVSGTVDKSVEKERCRLKRQLVINDRGFGQRSDLLLGLLGRDRETFLGLCDEVVEGVFDGLDGRGLDSVAVVEKTGADVRLARHGDAEVDELVHDRLEHGDGGVLESLGLEHLYEVLESLLLRLGCAEGEELLGALGKCKQGETGPTKWRGHDSP